jgi:nicotinate-nucleotide adenylyltransferase
MQAAQQRVRIGVFGGAFDPPHVAHQALVQAAQTQLALDRVLVIPTGQAWHKPRPLSAAVHRLAMCGLAFADWPLVHIDARETTRDGPSYTVDTLRQLATEEPQADFFLLVGADQARAFTTWRAWAEILQIATICVAHRGEAGDTFSAYAFEADYPDRICHLSMPAMDVSATTIRQRVAAGRALGPLVCQRVAGYIADHHLYQSA